MLAQTGFTAQNLIEVSPGLRRVRLKQLQRVFPSPDFPALIKVRPKRTRTASTAQSGRSVPIAIRAVVFRFPVDVPVMAFQRRKRSPDDRANAPRFIKQRRCSTGRLPQAPAPALHQLAYHTSPASRLLTCGSTPSLTPAVNSRSIRLRRGPSELPKRESQPCGRLDATSTDSSTPGSTCSGSPGVSDRFCQREFPAITTMSSRAS